MNRAYDHRAIESKAREKWEYLNLSVTDLSDKTKDPYYLLVEFPYPSGDMHIGHWYAFAVTDIYARMLRARGKNVLFPIGFDAFGLPAENAAIKHGVDPKDWTYKNIERMRTQLKSMGASFDWSKEVIACDPSYYKWTQWLFTKLFEQGLAEHKEASVKWCPKDQTVLANEQVMDGCCERCGTEVEEKTLTQWFLKITQYAERLLTGLNTLPWREDIKEAQRAWIGKSDGATLTFMIGDLSVDVFTTRPDTVFGVTYLVLAPEHSALENLPIENKAEVDAYIAKTKTKTERERSENKEKTGTQLSGVMAINPATKEEIPVYIADYVIGSYGTGAIMAVPAHDDRDLQFALKFNLPICPVIARAELGKEIEDNPRLAESLRESCIQSGVAIVGDGILFNSGEHSGRSNKVAMWDIVDAVGGKRTTSYRLRDWLVSRQRYWGCPIPIVYDPKGEPHTIPPEHLPWKLPTDVDFTPTGESPLASSVELRERVTRIFGDGWTPEYDTLDTFVDSSWYFNRYLSTDNEHSFSDDALMKKWLPVNRYSGGSEHTNMHLLYARFFTMALYDIALSPVEEPFIERFNRGLIMGPDGHKMSKSKGNVLNPDEFVEKYGADAVRVYLAFIGPYNEPGNYPWNLDGVAGMRKFLERIVSVIERKEDVEVSEDLMRKLARASTRISSDGDRFKFNTAVSALMILLNEFESAPKIPILAVRDFVCMLAPFAPHLAEALWETLGQEGSVHVAEWPVYDPDLLQSAVSVVAVQVNGKRRGVIELPKDSSEDDAILEAKKISAIENALNEQVLERVIYVPERILNFVTRP